MPYAKRLMAHGGRHLGGILTLAFALVGPQCSPKHYVHVAPPPPACVGSLSEFCDPDKDCSSYDNKLKHLGNRSGIKVGTCGDKKWVMYIALHFYEGDGSLSGVIYDGHLETPECGTTVAFGSIPDCDLVER